MINSQPNLNNIYKSSFPTIVSCFILQVIPHFPFFSMSLCKTHFVLDHLYIPSFSRTAVIRSTILTISQTPPTSTTTFNCQLKHPGNQIHYIRPIYLHDERRSRSKFSGFSSGSALTVQELLLQINQENHQNSLQIESSR